MMMTKFEVQSLMLISMLLLPYTVVALKIVTFGDSTLENNRCSSIQLGVPFPPVPPYSEFIRYSSKYVWVDYLDDILGNVTDIFSCACGASFASKDVLFDPLNSGAPATLPGLLTQIKSCIEEKNLVQMAEDDDLIAIIQHGGNDFFFPALDPSQPVIFPQQVTDAFRSAVEQLTEAGVVKIYMGITILNEVLDFNPAARMTQLFQPTPFAEAAAIAFSEQFLDEFEKTFLDLQSQDFPVFKISLDSIYSEILKKAQSVGIDAVNPCIYPSVTQYSDPQILPTCTDFNERVWFDGVHLADWAHKQYAENFAKILS